MTYVKALAVAIAAFVGVVCTSAQAPPASEPTYVGSAACARCHAPIFNRWKQTRMANVVRDPRDHPEAVLPDFSKTEPLRTFGIDEVAFVYGSKFKQRYFKKVGDDFFPFPAQWDVTHRVWRPYGVSGATSALCDGCHSVNYNIERKTVTEWNVGCERCHGPASAHVAHPSRATIVNPSRLDSVSAVDVCVQCHSEGHPREATGGTEYHWPVGFRIGRRLSDFWQLDVPTPGQNAGLHYADGTARENRMQGNDFVQSQMSLKGVRCYGCHDVHGTPNEADLRLPGNAVCLQCHDPRRQPGPPGTLEQHTQHAASSEGSKCIACHMPLIARTVGTVNVRSHTFKFISPSTTLQNGVPNPCTSCHKDRTPQWASDALKKWPGVSAWRVGG